MIEQFDVVVFGAGPAGLCAALQAARAGAKTALVEKNGICGGTLTFCGVNYPGIFAAWGRQIIAGIGWELLVKTWNECNEGMPENRIPYMHQKKVDKLVFAAFADEALVSAGVDIRFHTMPGKAERDEKSNLWNLTLCDKDGLYDICSKVVIDCTGDANVIHMAKLPCRMPEETQPGTLSMYFHNFDESKLDFDLLEQRFNQALAEGRVVLEDMGWAKRFNRGFFTGHGGNSNHIVGYNGADSAGRTKMEIDGRKSILRMFRFLRSCPGLEDVEFHLNSGECGVRETRMIEGEVTITVEDYISGRKYPDGICHGFYPIDLHDAKTGCKQKMLPDGVLPSIPFRALIPRGSHNILAAGRCLSADRLSHSALRVQGPCMAMGQAAGAAAALAVNLNCEVRNVPIDKLRALLKEHNAILPETEQRP